MSESDKLNFRISSALKDIIGKELITDDFIAVFELVKNSFDAHATKVEIKFVDFRKRNPKIIIKDNGKGMNYDDLIDKFLFVAYSAKKDGTEDKEFDYRDKIYTKRLFAGAKGIGRFSCDRLGSELNLISIKKESKPKIENLFIDWGKFEKDSKEEFIKISVTHNTLNGTDYNLKHGTILELKDLRDKEWNREKLVRLKQSLVKLVNPNQENDVRNFSIELIADHVLDEDKLFKNEREKVNGVIKNEIFEQLGLKTTQILNTISKDGKIITTELIDRGVRIYWIKERNEYTLLKDIKFHLFYLNFGAKYNFTKIMGVDNVKYGSIFLYKNGFRVYPFGEEHEDYLGIDRRKQQGFARYLGTRELLGRIEINGDDKELRETTSRDGGLVKTKTYDELGNCFKDKCLTRLEKYVVDVINWGTDIPENDISDLSEIETKEKIFDVISKLSKSKNIIDFDYDKKFLNVLKSTQEQSLTKMLSNFQRIAKETDNENLLYEANRAEKQLLKLKKAKEEAEKEVEETKEEKKKVENKLTHTMSQNFFLKSLTSNDFDQVVGYLHNVGIYANSINNHIVKLSRKINNGEKISNEYLRQFIDKVTLENTKILTFTKFATKSGFKAEEDETKDDINAFIENYINRNKDIFESQNIKINLNIKTAKTFIIRFKPLEIMIIVDNLFSNAKKSRPKNINWNLISCNSNELQYSVSNDGKPLDDDFKDPQIIFEKGVTNTKGAGLGLYHVKQILNRLNGDIEVNKMDKGIEFKIILNK